MLLLKYIYSKEVYWVLMNFRGCCNRWNPIGISYLKFSGYVDFCFEVQVC
jgi:hypothetical protein